MILSLVMVFSSGLSRCFCSMPDWSSRRLMISPLLSLPIMPAILTCAPKVRALSAALAAPPSPSWLCCILIIGTGASGEIRLVWPVQYWSNIKSPINNSREDWNWHFVRSILSIIVVIEATMQIIINHNRSGGIKATLTVISVENICDFICVWLLVNTSWKCHSDLAIALNIALV